MCVNKTLSTLILLILLAAAPPAAADATPVEPAKLAADPLSSLHMPGAPAGATPLSSFLRPDGTLALDSFRGRGFRGSLDPRGYRLVSGPNEAPRFARTPESETLAPDDHWDGRFFGIPGTDGLVRCVAVDSRGYVYIGGDFSSAGGVPASHVARWDGIAWSALGSGTNSFVIVMVVDESDVLYVGGLFSTAGGVPASHVARWDGIAWSALGSGTNGDIHSVALDSSGNLYVGGYFTMAGGVPANYIARWDGATWSALGSGVNAPVHALAVDGAGTLYAGGDFSSAGGVPVNYVARWDGTAWSALGSGTDGLVDDMAVDGSGNLYAGGAFSYAGGLWARNIARWDGAAWSALGSGLDNRVYGLAVLPAGSGDLYAAGDFITAGGLLVNHIARWDGATWSALDSGFDGTGAYMAMDSSGYLYAGGSFTIAGGRTVNNVARWDGAVWSALGGEKGLDDTVGALLAVDGSIYAGGEFYSAASVPVNYIARWDGATWSALGSGMGGCDYHGSCVHSLAAYGSGAIYAGGNFNSAGGVPANRIARWDGTAWSALGSGMDGCVETLLTDGSGNLYAGGNFNTASGVPAHHIARWDGADWSALGSGMDGSYVFGLAMDSSGNLYAGGSFSTTGGVPANNIARWDGASWSALGSGVNGPVYHLAMDRNGNLYAGGIFTTAGGGPANSVAVWDGTAWSALGSGIDGPVYVLAVDRSGDLYVGGSFATAGGKPANSVAVWDGTDWSVLGSGVEAMVGGLAIDDSGDVYFGGDFVTAGGKPSPHFARWYNTPPQAVNDVYATPADTPLVVPAPGVLANDSDPENDPLTATLGLPPFTGTAALSVDGAFTYTPALSFSGLIAFTYAVTDGYGGIATATAVVRVGEPPLAGTLLVDDDADSPDVRAYYTTALDRLGVAYDVWDTAAWGSPVAQVLQGRDTVLWFTGANRADTFTTADEAVVGDYLRSGTWQSETVDETGNAGYGNSLALDAAGEPHISYLQCDPSYPFECFVLALKYAYLDAAGWHTTTVDSASGGTSLALDAAAAGHPHIAYDNAAGLAYAYLDGTGWHTETVDPLGSSGSLALDAAGHARIAYNNAAGLAYAYLDGTGWHTETVDSAGTVGTESSLALDMAENPHIAYSHAGDLAYAYLYLGGTGWHTETVDSGWCGGRCNGGSLALDAAGHPHIIYGRGEWYVRYAFDAGSGWISKTLATGSGCFGVPCFYVYPSALALDPAGRPHVTWRWMEWGFPYHPDNSIGLIYSYFDGSAWHQEDVAQWTYGNNGADLALDRAGSAYVSYPDYLGLRLATRSPAAHFFLSSEDYLHEMGLTSFGQDSLGIITYTDDVSQTDVVGTPGSPIGDGLGPYTLTLPPGWSTFWTDAVSGTQSPFRWQGTGRNNSTNYDGVHFRTVFFGWPLEGLADLDDRAAVLCAVLGWFGGCGGPCDPVQGAGFTWAPVTPTVGLPVTFTGTVAGGDGPITYTWKLGVGSWKEGQVVTYTFSSAGVYTVALTATNCAGAVATAVHTLTVQPPCVPVAGADFIWQPITPTVDAVVTFTATATGTLPITYTWSWGDGTASPPLPLREGGWGGRSITHTYTAAGLYTVILTATNDCGSWQAVTDTLTVTPTCQGVGIVSVTAVVSDCMATFDAALTGSEPFTYLWDLGPFGTYSDANPVVDFQATGTYTGTLRVWNCGNAEPAPLDFTVEVACQEWYFIYLPLVVRSP